MIYIELILSPSTPDGGNQNINQNINFQKPNGSLFNNFINTVTNTTQNFMQLINTKENNLSEPTPLR